MPPSTTIVRLGAWRRWASAVASIGAPTPVNTVWPSRSSRAPMTASSSLVETGALIAARRQGTAHRRDGDPAGRWVAAHLRETSGRSGRSLAELERSLARRRDRAGPEQGEVFRVRAGSVDVAIEVPGNPRRPAVLDRVDVAAEVRGL